MSENAERASLLQLLQASDTGIVDVRVDPGGATKQRFRGGRIQRPIQRMQVRFAEKDDSGGTHLYPLTDFHPRKEENRERGYLQGRYGAVPFLGELVAKVDRRKDR